MKLLHAEDRLRRLAAWGVLSLGLLLLVARGGKVYPVALAVQSALLAAAGALLVFRRSDDFPRPFLACLLLSAASHGAAVLVSDGGDGLLLGAGRFWSAVSFGILARFFWGRRQWRAASGVLFLVAAAQASLTVAAACRGVAPFQLLPGSPQYGALWMMTAFLAAAAGGDGIPIPRFGRAALLSLLGAGVMLSSTRSAVLGLAAGGAFLACKKWGMRGLLWCGAAAAAIFVSRMDLFMKPSDAAAWKRWDIWAAAWRGILDRPWAGWGPGRFETLYRLHALPQDGALLRFDHATFFAHNDFLQTAAAVGVPGLAALVGIWIMALRPRPQDGFAGGAISWGGAVMAFFNFPFALPVNGLLAGAVGAWSVSGAARREASPLTKALGSFLLGLSAAAAAGLPGSLAQGPSERVFRGDASVFLSQGEALWRDPARREEAGELIGRALRLNPGLAETWRAWASVAAAAGSPPALAEAADALRRALRLHPRNAVWWTELGLLEESRGLPVEAALALREALRAEPRCAEAAFHLGRLMRRRGEDAKALRWWERLRKTRRALQVDAGGLSPYARRVLAWDEAALSAEIDRCRKDIIRRK